MRDKEYKEFKAYNEGYEEALNDVLNACKSNKEQAYDAMKSHEGEEPRAVQDFSSMIKGIETVEKQIKILQHE